MQVILWLTMRTIIAISFFPLFSALLRGVTQENLQSDDVVSLIGSRSQDIVSSDLKPSQQYVSLDYLANKKMIDSPITEKSKQTLKAVDAMMKSTGVTGMRKVDLIDDVANVLGGKDKTVISAMEATLDRWREIYEVGVKKNKVPSIEDIQVFYASAQTDVLKAADDGSPEAKTLLENGYKSLLNDFMKTQTTKTDQKQMRIEETNQNQHWNPALEDKIVLPEGPLSQGMDLPQLTHFTRRE